MTLTQHHTITLTQFLIEERRRFPDASGDFNALILNVAMACKAIAKSVASGALADMYGNYSADNSSSESINVQGEAQKKLDVISNEIFLKTNEWGGYLAGMVSEEMEHPYNIPAPLPKGKYLLVFDPLDGSSNIDINVSVGSIFSVLRLPSQNNPTLITQPDSDLTIKEIDFLQKGCEQLAAGYAIYGPTTMLVLSVGNGVQGFTLDPLFGEFMLTHPKLQVPVDTKEFAINASNARFWEAPVKRYVDECLAGSTGVRGKDFNMRWIASMVAEAHRILMRGGVFLYPKDNKDPKKPGRLRLLYEANPIGFIMEQASGRVSTGSEALLQVKPTSLHQRIGVVFGSKNEVERIERYHKDSQIQSTDTPLFNHRSLFRD